MGKKDDESRRKCPQLIPSLRSWGATGLLLEYEDTFPYEGNLRELASPEAYSKEQIHWLQYQATSNGLEVIPLVQTFGHLEFVLKHKKFHFLREDGRYPNSICPSRDETLWLIYDMINQVVRLHPNVRWIHIGGDEVWQLGQCERCARLMAAEQWTREQLFLRHIKNVADYVRTTHPGLGIIVWDDMFRCTDIRIILSSGIQNLVEPMIWNYGAPEINLPQDIWERFSMAFNFLWVGSAFKGATGACRVLPDVAHHVGNHEAWLSALESMPEKMRQSSFRGWALTGWQRNDHFSVLCELLPAAIPSLVLCLRTIQSGRFDEGALVEASKLLGSPHTLNLAALSSTNAVVQLQFPGSSIFHKLRSYVNWDSAYEMFFKSDGFRGWFSEFHARYRNGNPLHIQPLFTSATSLWECFRGLRNELETDFDKIFMPKMAEEWFLENIDPKIMQLENTIAKIKDILEEQEK